MLLVSQLLKSDKESFSCERAANMLIEIALKKAYTRAFGPNVVSIQVFRSFGAGKVLADVAQIACGPERRMIHDDITVVVFRLQ